MKIVYFIGPLIPEKTPLIPTQTHKSLAIKKMQRCLLNDYIAHP